ncbi:MAG TPA: hypothetical protein VEG42_04840 [Thermoplasmata archaeon]|nr:hypothetical protein [Thermoplasmata archaeon]
MSDNPDGRAILASLPAWFGSPGDDVDLPLAGLPCLRLESTLVAREGIWVA